MGGHWFFGQRLQRFLVLPATGPELATGSPDFRFEPHHAAQICGPENPNPQHT
jgi:hypothetical protein